MTDLTTSVTGTTANPVLCRTEVSIAGGDGAEVGTAVVVTVVAPSGWDDLLARVATEMGAFMAVSRLGDDGQDRADLLIAGVEGDVAIIDTLGLPDEPDEVTAGAVRAVTAWLDAADVTLTIAIPRIWGAGSTEGRVAAAAGNGFEQWCDTDVWTRVPGV